MAPASSTPRPSSRHSATTTSDTDIELATLAAATGAADDETTGHTPAAATPALSLSARSSAAAPSIREPPVEEWTTARSVAICVSAFFVIFTTCGAIFAFGVYQEMYQTMATERNTPFTGASPAVIDLIGTLSGAFMTIPGPAATAWTKRFGPRNVIFAGAVLYLVGSIAASYSQHVWQFLLTQGFIMGLATCFSYLPAVTVAPTWFGKHRGLAMGFILSGTGVGGLVWAPVIHALTDRLGFRNALRVSGAFTTAMIAMGGVILDWDPVSKRRLAVERQRLNGRPHSRVRALWDVPLVDWRIARTHKFAAQVFASFVQAAAYFTPVFFFSAYARTLHYSAKEGANFIAINNACNAIGKVVVGMLADRWGRVNMLVATTVVSAISSFAFWLPSTLVPLRAGKGLFITYSLLYGFTASPYVSLFPTCLVELFGPQHFASINGAVYMVRGFGSLFGTPAAGALIRGSAHAADPSGYLNMSIMVGVLLTAASFGTLWIKWEAKR